jgi:hypothetical protein
VDAGPAPAMTEEQRAWRRIILQPSLCPDA